MAVTHLVDTSVLTRLRLRPVRTMIESRANSGELARAGISDLEVGYSARSDAEWDRLMEALGIFELVETTADHVHRAAGAAHARREAASAAARFRICSSRRRPRRATSSCCTTTPTSTGSRRSRDNPASGLSLPAPSTDSAISHGAMRPANTYGFLWRVVTIVSEKRHKNEPESDDPVRGEQRA